MAKITKAEKETNHEYVGEVERMIDGDTVYLRLKKTFSFPIDFGFHITGTLSETKEAVIDCRLLGINAPEMEGPSKEAGLAAKIALTKLISGRELRVLTQKTGKYGRWLATIYFNNDLGVEINANQWMIDHQFAVVYNP